MPHTLPSATASLLILILIPISASNLFQQFLPARPGRVECLFVRLVRSRILFLPSAHKTVPGSFVNDRLINLPGSFHLGLGVGHAEGDPPVVFAVKAIHRALDLRHVRDGRRSAVKNESRLQVRPVAGKSKRLSATPAKTAD